MTAPRLTALVVAGGSARRFGGDKLAAPLGPGRVVDGALAAVQAVAGRVLLAGPPALAPDLEHLRDAVPAGSAADAAGARLGPLAAVVAGLEAATTPLLAVVAGDLPHAQADVLLELASAWCGEVAVLPTTGGVTQPLHAVWSVEHGPAVRAAFDAGARSPSRVSADLGAAIVDVGARDAGWARDVDTPADLDVLRSRFDG